MSAAPCIGRMRRSAWLAGLVAALAGPAAQAAGSPAGAPDASPPLAEPAEAGYQLGQGLRLGDSGVTLGGYVTGEYQRLQGAGEQLRSSHASVFFWWEGLERAKVFGEVDLENLVTRYREADDGDSDYRRRVTLERLYLDWTFHDALTLRLGKFLAPIGRWNLSHADPLVWTTSRPLLTQSVFPHNLTGLMARGTLPVAALDASYALYASNGSEWAPDERQDLFTTVRGGRVVLPFAGEWQLGLSYARYEQRGSRGELRQLAGIDVLWTHNRYELSAEWLQTTARRPGPLIQPEPDGDDAAGAVGKPRAVPSRGAYVQGVMPLPGRLYAIGRLEWLRDTWSMSTMRQALVGLAWRPQPAVSLKAEYRWPRTSGTVREGWAASVSVLF